MTTSALTADQIDKLAAESLAARKNAYAPFSEFKVGAAILRSDGQIYRGANVENSSYGLTICAERSAACAAATDGMKPGELVAVAIAAEPAAPPCGACRQFLYEFGDGITLILVDATGAKPPKIDSLDRMLPDGFRLDPATKKQP